MPGAARHWRRGSARAIDEEAALRARDELRRSGGSDEPEHVEIVEMLAVHAPAVLSYALRDAELVPWALASDLERPRSEADMRSVFAMVTAHADDGATLRRTLRKQHHRETVRVVLREVMGLADIDTTSREMAAIACGAIEAALDAARRTAFARFGRPHLADGSACELVVLGMGKLGGDELNLGSDVDLCFFYPSDDATVDGDSITAHELLGRVAKSTAAALADVTEDGFVYRVDLRLRPEGTRGPLVNSLASAERYYETWGRTWERAALLRARPVAGDRGFGRALLDALRPFVFRRSVDPGVAREMAEMLARTRRELRVDDASDVKLGRGAIREAEFFVQTLQLVWGGRHPDLQVPGTMDALGRLRSAGLVSDREADALADAWALLRRVEHRIHASAGYQSHSLPPDARARDRLARSLGFSGTRTLEGALREARAEVAELFDSLGAGPATGPDDPITRLCDRVAAGAPLEELVSEVEQVLGAQRAEETTGHLLRLGRRADMPLGPVGRERRKDVGPLLLREAAGSADVDAAIRALADLFNHGPIGSFASTFERMLAESPHGTRRLVSLLGASRTLAQALVGHPETTHALVSTTAAALDPVRIAETVADEVAMAVEPEELVATLRRIKREITLRIGLLDVADELELDDVLARLSALAEAEVAAAIDRAMVDVCAVRGVPMRSSDPTEPSRIAVFAMGKLGGRELGYAGDLDLLFVYDEDGETTTGRASTEVFARAAQRAMALLSVPDAEGPGWSLDTRLRPSGNQGLLVVSRAGFLRYHEKGARAWERQALLKARPIGGDPDLGALLAHDIAEIAYAPAGDFPALAAEIVKMRRRMQDELGRETPDRMNLKTGRGGLVDIEFLVQALQMRHGATDASVRTPSTREALTALAAHGYLARNVARRLDEAYVLLRSMQQCIALLDDALDPTLVVGSRVLARVARRLAIRDRDGAAAVDVMLDVYRRTTADVRAVFEAELGAV
ncbi:MAG: bifunctional [glutamate--ammonia ligase]-adenylyl-L-tyrosine phosphorylase/[glutamate--ammonia-ligase] adenylyltransferase [Deltaproteobacteria bacterium]|nr:bifunctional [glutamate--ammonia ligase]-adenylyl-L-tyrosine phosphorylase/[glutamate--ammonia-ligase] adenylyltransferase [Deltaproteobacteria bacterium]